MKTSAFVVLFLLLPVAAFADIPSLTNMTATNGLPKEILWRTTYFRGDAPILKTDRSIGKSEVLWQEILSNGKPIFLSRKPRKDKLLRPLSEEYYAWEHDLTGDQATDLVVISSSTDPLIPVKEAFLLTDAHLLQPVPSEAVFDTTGEYLSEYRVVRNVIPLVSGADPLAPTVSLPLSDGEEELTIYAHAVQLGRTFARNEYAALWNVHTNNPQITLAAAGRVGPEVLLWLANECIEQMQYDMASCILTKIYTLHALDLDKRPPTDPLRLACEYAIGDVAFGKRYYPRARAIFQRVADTAGSNSVYCSLGRLRCADIKMTLGEGDEVSYSMVTAYGNSENRKVADEAGLVIARHLFEIQGDPIAAYRSICELILVAAPEALPRARGLRAKIETALRNKAYGADR